MNKLVDLTYGVVAKIEYDYSGKIDLIDGINCEVSIKVGRITFLKENYYHNADVLLIEQYSILQKEISKLDGKMCIIKIEEYNKRLPF